MSDARDDLSRRLSRVPRSVVNGSWSKAARYKDWAQLASSALRAKRTPSKLLQRLVGDFDSEFAESSPKVKR